MRKGKLQQYTNVASSKSEQRNIKEDILTIMLNLLVLYKHKK